MMHKLRQPPTTDHQPPAGHRPLGILLLISLLFSIYTFTNAGRFHIIDEVSLFAVTESMTKRGEVDTNAIAWSQWVNSPGEVLGANGPDGETYSKKGPAPAFLAIPWYGMMWLGARMGLGWGVLQGTLLWNGWVTALTAGLLWQTAIRLGYRDRVGAILGLCFGLGTIAWPYANHFFGEPLSALCLLFCFYCLTPTQSAKSPPLFTPSTRFFLAGIAGGLAVATVNAHALLVAIMGLYGLWNILPILSHSARTPHHAPRTQLASMAYRALLFATPILLTLVLLGWYNFVRFGDPLDTGYHFDSGEGFTTPVWHGLWGLLISPYRGVFWHTPLLIASIVAVAPFLRRHRAEGIAIIGLSVVLIGLYSLWWMWWGGFAWGPRFLVPLTPFWVLLLAPMFKTSENNPQVSGSIAPSPARTFVPRHLRSIAISAFVISTLIQLSAVAVNYVNYEIQLRERYPTDWADPLKYGPPAQNLAGWRDSPVVGQFSLMAQDLPGNTDLPWLWADGTLRWTLLVTGLLVIGVQSGLFWRWFRGKGRTLVAVAPFLTMLLLFTWLDQVASSPEYGSPDGGYRPILEEIGRQAGPDDAIVTIAPFHYHQAMNWYTGTLPIYGYATDSMDHSEAQQALADMVQTHGRIWFVMAGLPAADPNNSVEGWLADHAYQASDQWYDDFRLVRYGSGFQADAPSQRISIAAGLTVTDNFHQIQIGAVDVPASVTGDQILAADIHFQLLTPATHELRWFVQLLGPDGGPVALLDTGPQDGYMAFPEIPAHEQKTEKAGLQLPGSLQLGIHQLIVGLYNPALDGGPRLHAEDGRAFVEIIYESDGTTLSLQN